MKVGDACNREVVVVERNASVRDAARLMRDFHVGDLIVVESGEGRRRPVGILTDRDIVVGVLARDVDTESVAVQDVMGGELVTATEDESLLDAVKRMRAAGVRRTPVVDQDGTLIGILTVDDLLDLLSETLSDLTRLVSREISREQRRRK
ncbi:MAG: histidine kinase [Candidatus Muproteobacteria bacterium RBG_16_62_13]|uniref:Histidine kinase n=1 Tax=Candidatus Muproteobacteria bacterium RBG_16_62_13 TaxID=1817756 RepID=A0A1F6T962_9PROT|nr:MAG: histidine kinase [Candidatus Muproteobacteria bacterium RBG_16_62_13]